MLIDRYMIAIVESGIRGQEMYKCYHHLLSMNKHRELTKGKPMTDSHVIQEAVKWARHGSHPKTL